MVFFAGKKLCDPCLSALKWLYHARRYISALLYLYLNGCRNRNGVLEYLRCAFLCVLLAFFNVSCVAFTVQFRRATVSVYNKPCRSCSPTVTCLMAFMNKKQEAPLTLRRQRGRCRNIIGNPKILGSSTSPKLHPLDDDLVAYIARHLVWCLAVDNK